MIEGPEKKTYKGSSQNLMKSRRIFNFFSDLRQDLPVKSAMDTTFVISFGTELNSLEGTNAETREFVGALDESNELINRRYVDPL